MGTRADFYIGRGKDAEWLGSVAWDGYPHGFQERPHLFRAQSEEEFRAIVSEELASRNDSTTPDRGWPWPWEDSNTTDWAYAFDQNGVYGSSFGFPWFEVDVEAENAGEPENEYDPENRPRQEFPNMAERMNVRLDQGSGLLVATFLDNGEEPSA